MIDLRPGLKRIVTPFFITILLFGNVAKAQDGQTLFQTNCAACHSINKTLTGPALAGVEGRWASKDLLVLWIKNWNKAVASGDPYAKQMAASTTNVMNTFENLGDKEIDAILAYIAKAPVAKPGAPPTEGEATAAYDESDNSILYGVLTLIMAVIALILLQVNSNLRKLTDDKQGVPAQEPIPFYRNKSYITLLTLILFVIGGYFTVKGAINLGRNKDYQPEQPIYYSHKVHAGKNQISCLYCHGGAMEGRHANIPSVNTCMNCHMTINEYTGTEKIYREDGTEVDGTAEIQKLYEYAGWDPNQRVYNNSGKPVEWIKIHNLPDHVYFNHSQHTVAGKVQCQTCHGNIQEMGEVKQFAELSMSWCVNCHRETKVDFVDSSGTGGNKFYSIYERYHNEIKSKTRDSVTVSDIGGIECQKCHY